jgi:hypothetical protein
LAVIARFCLDRPNIPIAFPQSGGAGGALAAGVGGVQLQNANGLILQLSGPKVGAEVSAAVGGVTITMR